jgi:ATP-dependent 26S proteasome regulatory subunit
MIIDSPTISRPASPTTNRPEAVDPAVLRPGRIDRRVFMGRSRRRGRAALFAKLLARMPAAEGVRVDDLPARTPGFSGAEAEHVANQVGLIAVKEAVAENLPTDAVTVRLEHFLVRPAQEAWLV